jgi:Uma2 family endonuclease
MSIAEAPSPPKILTAEDIYALPDDGIDREIIRGELKERPAVTRRNRYHSRTETRIAKLLDNWLDNQPLPRGLVVSGEAGFRIRNNPETFVGIDVAYVSAKVVAATPGRTPFFDGPPVLAVEILSPSDTHEDEVLKVQLYLDAGIVVWVVDPDFQTVHVHRPGQVLEQYNRTHELTGTDYLPGFRVSVAEFFE